MPAARTLPQRRPRRERAPRKLRRHVRVPLPALPALQVGDIAPEDLARLLAAFGELNVPPPQLFLQSACDRLTHFIIPLSQLEPAGLAQVRGALWGGCACVARAGLWGVCRVPLPQSWSPPAWHRRAALCVGALTR